MKKTRSTKNFVSLFSFHNVQVLAEFISDTSLQLPRPPGVATVLGKKAEFTVLTSILIDFTPAAAKFATGLQAEAGALVNKIWQASVPCWQTCSSNGIWTPTFCFASAS
ncbi:uncharacterized protein LOC124676491 [Lolium rigidum]|uniref:uncharacterized protein LOC124676491 n=1 Tax=Lolium rigidum TaxID=89674 RepID=UPI001F5DF617|nr:uncharacterized protein LOC124676491 [Lolium rigidum]